MVSLSLTCLLLSSALVGGGLIYLLKGTRLLCKLAYTLGVVISYLTIIGDLILQGIRGFNQNSDNVKVSEIFLNSRFRVSPFLDVISVDYCS